MDLIQAIKLECCEADSRARNKEEILLELARLTTRAEVMEKIDPQDIYKALKEREEKGSTGFGGGIAIPHSALEGATDFVVAIVMLALFFPFFERLIIHKIIGRLEFYPNYYFYKNKKISSVKARPRQ